MMRLAINLLAGAAIIAAMVTTLPARAGAYDRDQVYADSHGNLIIESAAGYKRILVGEGASASKLRAYTATRAAPETAGARPPFVIRGGHVAYEAETEDCWRPSALVKGRAYMYGFDSGEIPYQGGPCR